MNPADGAAGARTPRARSYLMCPPEHFTVQYAINPWMDPARPVDAARAMAQWENLRETHTRLGHQVRTIPAEPGLPDMVFAANGGTVIGGRALGTRFRYPQREPESAAYFRWFQRSGFPAAVPPGSVNEGEGDIVFAGRAIIAGHGFRSDEAAAQQVAGLFGLPVVSVRLVDPRFITSTPRSASWMLTQPLTTRRRSTTRRGRHSPRYSPSSSRRKTRMPRCWG